MTFTPGDRVYWVRPSRAGDGRADKIPGVVRQLQGPRVTIETWGALGTSRIVSVPATSLIPRETLGDVADRLEDRR